MRSPQLGKGRVKWQREMKQSYTSKTKWMSWVMGRVQAHTFLSLASFFTLRIFSANPTHTPLPSSWERFPVLHLRFPSRTSFSISGQRCHGSTMCSFETWPNWGHGSPPPCPGVVLCTAAKWVGNAAASEQLRLLSHMGFCWSGDVPNAPTMATGLEQTSTLPLCFVFLRWGQTRAAMRVTSAPGCSAVL